MFKSDSSSTHRSLALRFTGTFALPISREGCCQLIFSRLARVLPVRREILLGILNCDLIGFHTYDYARHFLSSVSRLLGLKCFPNRQLISHCAARDSAHIPPFTQASSLKAAMPLWPHFQSALTQASSSTCVPSVFARSHHKLTRHIYPM